MASAKSNVVDILLQMEVPEPQTKQVKITRLSEQAKQDVVFTLKEITYSQVGEIIKRDDSDIHTVLAGVQEPSFKNEELCAKYGAPTPAELVKRMLQPGEISDLSREIQKLSGYLADTLTDVEEAKKN